MSARTCSSSRTRRRTSTKSATLLAELDKAEPQVEIEAKIIQTNHDTARQLGVQWGFNGRVSPDLGNTTNLAFPNNGSVSGRTTQQGPVTQGPNDPRGSADPGRARRSTCRRPARRSAIGLSMGAINGAFNLDVALSALEHKGQLKILSTPKVTTQNNQEAEVTQGFQIPIQIVANNTVTVQFKDAALKLTVTPQITAANTVIMKINLENGLPDFSRAVNGNPSINTQNAQDAGAGGRRHHDRHRRHRAEHRDDGEGLGSWDQQDSAAGLAVPARRERELEPGTADLHHSANSSLRMAMTTCARLAQNVRPLGGLVGRGAALVALGLLPLVAGCTKAQQQGTGSSYLI